MVECLLNVEGNGLRGKSVIYNEGIQMFSEKGVVLVTAVDRCAVIAEKPQVFVAQFIMREMLQQLFQRKQFLFFPFASGPGSWSPGWGR